MKLNKEYFNNHGHRIFCGTDDDGESAIVVSGVYYSKQAKEADILAIDVNPMRTLVAMGDSKGAISVFRHPCSKQGVR